MTEGQRQHLAAEKVTRRILIIDDDEDDYIITRDMLSESRREKWIIDWAPNYENGLAKLQDDHYQAVLVDYDLGKHTGLDLIREVTGRGCHTPLILLTGRGSYEVDLEAMQAGATLYLTKNEANPLLLERSIRYAVEIKHRERALQESETRERAQVFEINAILDAVPAVVWITRDKEAREITGNRAAYDLLRVPRGDNMSVSAPEDQGPRNFQVFQNGRLLQPEELPIQRAAATGTPIYDFEEDIVFENGDTVHLLGNVIPLLDEGKPCGAVGALIDITDREKAEQALQESEARYKNLFTTMQEGFALGEAILDETGQPNNFRFLEINDAFQQQSGLSRDILGRPITEVLVNLERDWIDTYCTVAMTGEPTRFERYNVDTQRYYDVYCYSPTRGQFAILFRDVSKEKEMEAALRENAARYRRLVENANEGIWNVDAEGRTDFINPRGAEILGYTVEEMLGRSAVEFLFPEDQSPGAQRLEKRKQGIAEIDDFRLRHKDGHEVWVRASSTPLYGEQGQYLGALAMMEDITIRKEAEKKLKVTMEELSRIARFPEESPNPIARVAANGLVLYNNQVAARTPGWMCRAGQPLPDPLLPLVAQSLDLGQEVQQDVQLGDKFYSISIVPFTDENYANLYASDVTERKEFEAALQQSEARFRQLADALPQLVWTARADGTVDYYNQRHREFNGIAPGVEGNWEWSPGLHPDDVQPTVDAWTQAVETGQVYQIEHRVQMAGGGFRWHLSRGFPVRDEQGRVVRWFGTATDIHDLKQTENVLAEYAEKLKRSNQELEQFAFVASHDLQEPLRKIKLFGTSIQQKMSGKIDADTEDHFKRMISASERMQAMIRDLLELSRISTQGQPFTPVDLSQVAAEVVSDLETRITRVRGRVIVEDLPTVEADAIQLHQVLQNLISNALKFHKPETPPEVRVSSETFRAKTDRRRMISILVEDNGIGFDEEYLEQILKPFNRLHGRNDYEGNGIGLAIVKKIVDRHQGEISVHSKPGEGSTFIITLPQRQNGVHIAD